MFVKNLSIFQKKLSIFSLRPLYLIDEKIVANIFEQNNYEFEIIKKRDSTRIRNTQ